MSVIHTGTHESPTTFNIGIVEFVCRNIYLSQLTRQCAMLVAIDVIVIFFARFECSVVSLYPHCQISSSMDRR